jgi:hypothetical protein
LRVLERWRDGSRRFGWLDRRIRGGSRRW